MTEQQDKTELEQMVDRWSVRVVTEFLAEICGEKADHIRTSYSDETLAKEWERKARSLNRIAGNL